MKKGTLITSIGSGVILVIAFVAFVLPSSLGEAGGPKREVFGKYKSREIVYAQDTDFLKNLQSVYTSYQQTYNREPSSNEYFDLYNRAFKNTVSQYAYEEAVKKSGYVVSEQTVNRRLREFFKDENGKFDQNLYKQADQEQIINIKKSLLSESIPIRYSDDLFGSNTEFLNGTALFGLKESDAELDFLKALDNNKRGFNLISFEKAKYPKEEVLKYANNNSAKFDKFDLSIITFSDKSQADKALQEITSNAKTFEDVSTEITSNYRDTQGKLTYPYHYQYSLETLLNDKSNIATLSSLKKDQVSEVLEITNGYAIFKKMGEIIKPNFEDESVIKDVTTYVNTYESTMIEDYYINIANEFIAEAKKTDFDSACEKLNVEKIVVPEFALNYGGSSFATAINSSLQGLSFADTNEDFLKTAFTLKENEYSKPMVMEQSNSTGYVIVIQYTPSTQPEQENALDASAFFAYQISSYDNIAAQNKLMKSKHVTNNVLSTFYGIE